MIVLGINFGHDGSVAVVRDGELLAVIESERLTRFKHSIGVTISDIEAAVETAGIFVEDIDYCGLCSTQQIEYVFEDPDTLSFELYLENTSGLPCSILDGDRAELIEKYSKQYLRQVVERGGDHPYLNRIPERWRAGSFPASQPTFEEYLLPESWDKPVGLSDLKNVLLDKPLSDDARFGMHVPARVKLKGREIPGLVFSHHYAHAASAYYMSNYSEAAILSHDGSLPMTGYWGGMIYYGEGNKLWPLAPHYLGSGFLYERVAVLLGLGHDTGPGKLMGLAPYGKPVFFDERFSGNIVDGDWSGHNHTSCELPDGVGAGRSGQLENWLQHCLGEAKARGYDFEPLGDTSRILEPINADIAASTQKLLEDTIVKSAAGAASLMSELNLPTENLCMTGGVALNCPANSLVFQENLFKNLSVAPFVHDGGIAIGAALAFAHNVQDVDRPQRTMDVVQNAYLGQHMENDKITAALADLPENIVVERNLDTAKRAAGRLARNEIVAWFDGRSEIGPRALGHRSILSDARQAENWERVNWIKYREEWRPFAPAVLIEDCNEWFTGAPVPSPYMLFTAQVKGDGIPAVTHVDGSARIQTVDESNGQFRQLLVEFKKLTGTPVIMNTSFNGPGEPIIETPEQARFFAQSKLDALYIGDFEFVRKQS